VSGKALDDMFTYDIEITYGDVKICKNDLKSGEYQTLWLNYITNLDNATIVVNTEYDGHLMVIFGAVAMIQNIRKIMAAKEPFLVDSIKK